MNIRDVMRQSDDPGKKKPEGESESTFSKTIQESLDFQNRYEKIYLEVLDQVRSNWEAAAKGRPISFQAVCHMAEKMADCLAMIKEGFNIFKRVKEAAYYHLNVVNSAWIALAMGVELGYSREKNILLGAAALLHDIGMCKMSPAILNKKEKLSFEEYELVRQHPDEGKKIVSALAGVSDDVVAGVYQEHERENGSGYPEGRRGAQIHEFAKIIGLADVFDATTHPRPYRTAVSPYDSIMELVEMKNRLFPDRLIKVFINQFSFYPIGSYVQLNTGEVGEVIKTLRNFPTRPTLQILVDKEGQPVKKPYFIKLAEENLVYVKETLTQERLQLVFEEKKA